MLSSNSTAIGREIKAYYCQYYNPIGPSQGMGETRGALVFPPLGSWFDARAKANEFSILRKEVIRLPCRFQEPRGLG